MKPCPFCGSNSIDVEEDESFDGFAHCESCGAKGPVVPLPSEYERTRSPGAAELWKSEAMRRWNERAAGDGRD